MTLFKNSSIERTSLKKKSILDNTKKVYLDEDYEKIEQPEKIKINLYDYQKTSICAMLTLENNRLIFNDKIIYNNALSLCEPFGSGKTIMILSLIAIKPMPDINPLINQTCGYLTSYVYNHDILKPNLIIVERNVIKQWVKTIKHFTCLKYFVIDCVVSLRKFEELLKNNELSYDIILVKNGKITTDFHCATLPNIVFGRHSDNNLLSEPKNMKTKEITEILFLLTKNKCWSRVIYDDYDMPNTKLPLYDALFYIYVSGTKTNKMVWKTQKVKNYKETLDELYREINDHSIMERCKIQTTQSIIEKQINIPKIYSHTYVIRSENNKFANLIKLYGQSLANYSNSVELSQMINGNAIKTASEYIGIKTSSVPELFTEFIKGEKKQIIALRKKINFIENFYKKFIKFEDEPKDTFVDLNLVKKSLREQKIPNIKYYNYKIANIIDDLLDDYSRKLSDYQKSFNRVIENIKEGGCQICSLPFDSSDNETIIISRCCGIILCSYCSIKSSNIKEQCGEVFGVCPNCKERINPSCDYIKINSSLVEELTTTTPNSIPINIKPNEKLMILRDIIFGTNKAKCRYFCTNGTSIRGLLSGKSDIKSEKKKIVIYAEYNETLDQVKDFLSTYNVKHLKLGGSYNTIPIIIEKFQNDDYVLLVNSKENCAGINLQFATDLVFMHRIIFTNIEKQVAGRLCRIGRKYNANLHYLLFENE